MEWQKHLFWSTDSHRHNEIAQTSSSCYSIASQPELCEFNSCESWYLSKLLSYCYLVNALAGCCQNNKIQLQTIFSLSFYKNEPLKFACQSANELSIITPIPTLPERNEDERNLIKLHWNLSPRSSNE